MDNYDQVEFAPFAAINDFMRADFRQGVLNSVYRNLPIISVDTKNLINQMTRSSVQVQGFRNAMKAPVPRLAKSAEKLFEENSVFAAQILQGWFEIHKTLAHQVGDLLSESEGWEVLPLDANRTQLPGFFVSWPKGYDFDRLIAAFKDKYSGRPVSEDEISLMVVWISMRLPYRESELGVEGNSTGDQI